VQLFEFRQFKPRLVGVKEGDYLGAKGLNKRRAGKMLLIRTTHEFSETTLGSVSTDSSRVKGSYLRAFFWHDPHVLIILFTSD